MFCLHHIVKDVYRTKGVNRKYIPVITKKEERDFVPKILNFSKLYLLPEQKEELARRIFSVENNALPTVEKRKAFNPKAVTYKR